MAKTKALISCEADLRLCFRICKKPVFSERGSIISMSELTTSVGKREMIVLLLHTCYFVIFVRTDFFLRLVPRIGCVIDCGTPWDDHVILYIDPPIGSLSKKGVLYKKIILHKNS